MITMCMLLCCVCAMHALCTLCVYVMPHGKWYTKCGMMLMIKSIYVCDIRYRCRFLLRNFELRAVFWYIRHFRQFPSLRIYALTMYVLCIGHRAKAQTK